MSPSLLARSGRWGGPGDPRTDRDGDAGQRGDPPRPPGRPDRGWRPWPGDPDLDTAYRGLPQSLLVKDPWCGESDCPSHRLRDQPVPAHRLPERSDPPLCGDGLAHATAGHDRLPTLAIADTPQPGGGTRTPPDPIIAGRGPDAPRRPSADRRSTTSPHPRSLCESLADPASRPVLTTSSLTHRPG